MKSLNLSTDDERTVQLFRAIGNPTRFRILQVLAEQQACICGDLVEMLPLAQSTVSEHLKVLKEAGLIQGTIDGPSTCYCIDPATVAWWHDRARTLFTSAERSTAISIRPDIIKEAVSAHYAARARQGLATSETILMAQDASCCAPAADGASCCATGSCGTSYSAEDLASLPAGVTGISLGCGNPVGLADVQPGETVLDLGSGGGIDCFLAAQRTGPDGRVIGVDMTPEMVRLARANAQEAGATNVDFRLGEIEHLPVERDSVNLVISNCVVNLAPDKDAVFREVHRVLRPGGRLVIADTVASGPVPAELQAKLELWSSCASGSLDRDAYLATLRAAGFARIDILAEDAVEGGDLGDGLSVSSMTVRAFKAD